MHEREVKLTPSPGFRLPALDGVAPDLIAGPDEHLDLQAVYFDTPELRLTRSGASLRHRDREGWTVKLPVGGDGAALLVRSEHTFAGLPGTPPAPAIDLVRAWLRTSRLEPVARLRTRRRRVQLTRPDGKRAAEVDDDEVSVLEDGRIVTRFREVEVELAPDTAETVADEIVTRLRSAGAGAADPTPKIVRALGERALRPPEVVVPAALPPDASARDAVRSALACSVARLLAHDAGVRLGDDPEMVHQARVATRRLRSDLRTFQPLLDPAWGASLRDELQWLGAELGAVRDTEVLLGLLRAKVRTLAPGERSTAGHLLDGLVRRWEEARIELLGAMRSARYARLLDRLVDAARAPELARAAESPGRVVLPALVRGPWQHLRRSVRALDDEPTDEALHEVRIRAKRLRYASEAVAPVVGRPALRLARRAAALQDVLGEHQDAVVAFAWLRDAARAAGTRREAFVAGMLAGMVRADERAARAAWPVAWEAVRSRRLRRWL